MAVKWHPRIWKAARHATVHELEALESAWGIKLPEDFERVAMIYQGMAPDPVLPIPIGAMSSCLGS